jgi:NitT/TauT family transport system permease protein
VLIIIFELLSSLLIQDNLLFPSPFRILKQSALNLTDADFLVNALSTLREAGISTGVALVCGVPIGLLIGRSDFLASLLMSPVDWFRSIPATALFPVFLLLFGIGAKTRVAIACYAAIFAVILPTIYGARSVDEDRIAHVYRAGLGKIQVFYHVVFWDSLPSVLSGTRLAVSSALVLIVVGEMFIGSNQGLGYLITDYQERYKTVLMYSTIVDVGIFGYAVNKIVRYLEETVK